MGDLEISTLYISMEIGQNLAHNLIRKIFCVRGIRFKPQIL